MANLKDLADKFKQSFSDNQGWFRGGQFTPGKQIQRIGSDLGYQARNTYLQTLQNAWSPKGTNARAINALQSGVNKIANVPRFEFTKPQVNTRLQPFNKIGQIGVNLAYGLPESIINTPRNYATGIARTGMAFGDALRDRKPVNLQDLAGGVAPLAESLIDVGTLGGARTATNIIKNVGKSGFKSALKKGAITGATQGGIQGLTYGVDTQYKKDFNAGEVAQSTLGGAAVGGALGATFAGIGYGYKSLVNNISNKVRSQNPQLTSKQANKQASKILKDKTTKPVKWFSDFGNPDLVYNDITMTWEVDPKWVKKQSGAIDLGAKIGEPKPETPFNKHFSKLIADRNVAQTTATQKSTKLAQIPSSIAKEVINVREGITTSKNKQVNDAVSLLDTEFKTAYNDAKGAMEKAGLKIGFLDNYVPHFWKESPEKVQEVFTASRKFKQSKGRVIPTYKEGIEIGLTPQYTHPAQMHEAYIKNLETFKANVDFFNKLKSDGIISQVRKEGMEPIQAQGLGIMNNWYAPKAEAGQIGRIFNPLEQSKLAGYLETSAKVSGGIQDIALSGGLPATPVNAFTIAQMQKEMLSGRIKAPFMAVVDSLSTTRSNKFFSDNASQIKKMQARNVPIRSSYSVDNMLDVSVKERLFGEGVGGAWTKLMNEPTFGKFMPALQIRLFNDIEAGALKQGMKPEQAADVASKAVRNFYGLTDTAKEAMKDKQTQDLIATGLFAPRYRESMVNFWVNTVKTIKNPLALENRTNAKFAIGTVLTYVAMDNMNYVFNGHGMQDNPEGKKDKLLIPYGDTTLGIPFLSSIATVPRGMVRIGGKVIKADVAGASKETFKTFASIGLKPLGEIASNEDHFGNEIYAEDDSSTEKIKNQVGHIFGALNHPYVRGFIELYTKPDKPTEQRLSMALELPFRFYKTESVENAPFWNEYHELKTIKEKFDTLKHKPEGAIFLEKNSDKIDRFNVMKGYMTEYFNETEGGGKSDVLKNYRAGLQGVDPNLLQGEKKFEISEDAPKTGLDKAGIYIKSAFTDPKGLYTSIREDEPIRKIRGGALVTERRLGVSVVDVGKKDTQVDHRIPKWAGGRDTTDNYQALTNADHKKKTAFERGLLAKVERGDMSASKAKKEIEKWHTDNNIKPVSLTQDEVSTVGSAIKQTKGKIETYSKTSGLASTVRSKWAVSQLTGLTGDEYKTAYKELVDGGVITKSVAELMKEAGLEANEYSYGSGSRWLSGSRKSGGSKKAKAVAKIAKVSKVSKGTSFKIGKSRKLKGVTIAKRPNLKLSSRSIKIKLPEAKSPNIRIAKLKGLGGGIKLV